MSTITPSNIGRADGECNLDVKALGNKVYLEKCEVYHERNRGGIIIPTSADVNSGLNKGKILSMGEEAKRDLEGLKVGDYVLYDALSVFYDCHPKVVTKSENIICKVEEE